MQKIYRAGDWNAPEGADFIRPEQEAAIVRMLNEPTMGVLLADMAGKGKTLQGAEFIVRLGLKRVLIVGIRETYGQWAERLEAQSDGAIKMRRLDSTKDGRIAFADFLAGADGIYFSGSAWLSAQDFAHPPVLDANGDKQFVADKKTGEPTSKVLTERVHLKTYAKMKPLEAFLFDEVQEIQSKTSTRRRTIFSIKSEWRVAMSATFYGNRVDGMWSPCRWIWPKIVDPSFHRWVAEWLETEAVYVTGGEKRRRVTGEKVEGAFVAQLPCYLRQEYDFTAPEPRIALVTLSPRQREQYDSLERDLLAWLDDHMGEQRPLVADLPIVLRQRLRTATLGEMVFDEGGEISFHLNSMSSKLHALRGVVDGWGDQPALILTDSKRFAKVTVARMKAAGYGAVEWSGDVSGRDRDEIKRRFMALDPEVRYIVGVIPAMAVGIDGLQSVCSKIAWLSYSENGILNEQALARIHRPGGDYENFEHVAILADGTLDVGVFSSLLAQRLSLANTLRLAV